MPVLSACLVCFLLAQGAPAPSGTLEDEAVLEAVFRSQIREVAPAADEGICLTVRRLVGGQEKPEDPSPALLVRLRKDHAQARPGSECRVEQGAPATVVATGARAVSLDVGPVVWRGADRADVEGGYTRGGRQITEEQYELVRRGEVWTVRKTVLKRIT